MFLQQQSKQKRRDVAAELEQVQAEQLALDATKAAMLAITRLTADVDTPAVQSEDSRSLNARRVGRRRGRRRSRAGGGAIMGGKVQTEADGMVQGLLAAKDRRKKDGVDRKEGLGARVQGARVEMAALPEHWEPIQLKLPEIMWRGVQMTAGSVRESVAQAGQFTAVSGVKRWISFSLNTQPVLAALDAHLPLQAS
jgi:hypothetical protein